MSVQLIQWQNSYVIIWGDMHCNLLTVIQSLDDKSLIWYFDSMFLSMATSGTMITFYYVA